MTLKPDTAATPCCRSTHNTTATLHRTRTRYPPHTFQLANNACYRMKRTTQGQAIMLFGGTANGKSENRRLAIKTLLELSVSPPGKKGLQTRHTGPRIRYTELQFSECGRPVDVKTLNRVSGAPNGERKFHIFYYLVAGATPEERQHLHLLDKMTYQYLGQHRSVPAALSDGGLKPTDDSARFDQLKLALKTIGLSKRHFTIDRSRNEDAAVVRNTDLCEIAASFRGVQPADLKAALSYKTKLVENELCTLFFDQAAGDYKSQGASSPSFFILASHPHLSHLPLFIPNLIPR
ncbi:P-loop containing nucleoside triphosphate hydrolase protein [Mycena alexandri]|uniref:P-loop containing nucleoside triphosphate hydrolase protein n=1 Tax=Mycena alexandri TaxID=1745969 RepID=A0AAD6WZF1_9AGAR|nr:P-loop containing nucleoside triphosphate hydrolase protein [Mycena alexandri]